MNIKYLKNVVIPQRELEIEQGKNACTRQPIYVVLDLKVHYCYGHVDILCNTNLKDVEFEYGYVDWNLDSEDQKFCKSNKRMKEPQEITQFYTDKIIAFFLTCKAANEYMQYQKHNLSKNAYVYTFYSGYGNKEMDNLLDNK